MNRYQIALGKIPPLGYRVLHKFYNHELLDALCDTGKDPLIVSDDLFEMWGDGDLPFWSKRKSDEEPNELGKMIMSIRDLELHKRSIDSALMNKMRQAAGYG